MRVQALIPEESAGRDVPLKLSEGLDGLKAEHDGVVTLAA